VDELALESFGALDEELRGARAEAGGVAVEKLPPLASPTCASPSTTRADAAR